MIKRKIFKLNIDIFSSTKDFEYFLFNYIKKIEKLSHTKIIIIYTLKQEKKILDYIWNSFIYLLEKLYYRLNENWFIIHLVNFPYCIIKERYLIEKYLLNKMYLFYTWSLQINHSECYTCDYSFTCLKHSEKDFLPKSFSSEIIWKYEINEKFILIGNFLNSIWFTKNDFLVSPIFIYDDISCWVSKKILDRTKIYFFWKDIFNTYFLDTKKYRNSKELLPNLLFKNYIYQKRFEKLINDLKISIHFEFHLFKPLKNETIQSQYINKYYQWIADYDVNFFLSVDISSGKRTQIWEFYLSNVWIQENRVVSLFAIKIEDIFNIKYHFDKYIVLIWNKDINSSIPYIYKFKYLLSCSWVEDDSIHTSHYKIISKELWMRYIDSVWIDYFFWLENNDLIEINFNTWFIKRIW